MHAKSLNHIQLFATLWTVARQAPLSMGFSSKNTGVNFHALLQGIFPTWGLNPCLLHLLHWQADSLPLALPGKPLNWKFCSLLLFHLLVFVQNIWMRLKNNIVLSVCSDSLWPHGVSSPWNSPGQNTGLGSLSLLQRIFPTQGLNQGLLHCRQIVYQLSYEGSPYDSNYLTTKSQQLKNKVMILFHRNRQENNNFTSYICI